MSNTITKKILIDRIADSTGMKRVAVKGVVQEFLDQVITELGEGNRLEFRDFGVFEVKQRAPRIAQNPKTLERVPVPAKQTVKFKAGRKMRDAMDAAPQQSDADASAATRDGVRQPQTAAQAEGKMRAQSDRDVVASISADGTASRNHEPASVR